jgi:hypothetical protein
VPGKLVPPRPWRTRLRKTSKTPPGSGVRVMALRKATLRVWGREDEKKAASQALATSMEKFQVSGASVSLPPNSPVASSMGRSRE